jgi:hypothetical protein
MATAVTLNRKATCINIAKFLDRHDFKSGRRRIEVPPVTVAYRFRWPE